MSFLQSIPTKHWFRNDLSLSVLRAQPHPIPCGVPWSWGHLLWLFQVPAKLLVLVSFAHRWHVRLLSSECRSCIEGHQWSEGTAGWKGQLGKETVMLVVCREVKGSVRGTGCKIWVPACDLGREQWCVMGVSLPILLDGFSSQFLLALLLSCSGTSNFVLLCPWSWLWAQWRDVTSLGCKMEFGEH